MYPSVIYHFQINQVGKYNNKSYQSRCLKILFEIVLKCICSEFRDVKMFLSCILKLLVKVFNRSGHIAHPMPIGSARACKTSEVHPSFWKRTFYLVKKKNWFDLPISSQTDKTMKKLQWIPKTIVSTSVLVIFWFLHIEWCQNSESK